jgi:hypothetical protein
MGWCREVRLLIYMNHVEGRGSDLFAAVCAQDLESVVVKWTRGRYLRDGQTTSWLKIRNPDHSQMQGDPRQNRIEGQFSASVSRRAAQVARVTAPTSGRRGFDYPSRRAPVDDENLRQRIVVGLRATNGR